MSNTKKPTIGFIGQGFIGKNYADDFEQREYAVVRYSIDPEYRENKEKIAECDIVFIAVPTPTTKEGFDGSIVEDVLSLIGNGNIAVIKSTIPPGMTRSMQGKYPLITIVHSPEFLSEVTAKYDAMKPFINIIGLPEKDERHVQAGDLVMSVLPESASSLVCTSEESEIIKYTHNCSGYVQIIFFNMMYDLTSAFGADWSVISQAVKVDPFISNRYSDPVHKSGRGAGGHCFIKDFATFVNTYKNMIPQDTSGIKVLQAIEEKNIELLRTTKKDQDLLRGVYGN